MDVRRTSFLAAALVAALLPLAGCSPAVPRGPGPGALSGVVRDTLGAPVAGADVEAMTLQPQAGQVEEASAVTGADGAFDLGLVTRTDWLLMVVVPGRVAADTVAAPATGVALVLRRAAVARGRATLAGAASHQGTLVMSDVPTSMTFTDSLGAYVLDGLVAGARELRFLRPPSTAVHSVRILVPAPGDTVTVPDVVLP